MWEIGKALHTFNSALVSSYDWSVSENRRKSLMGISTRGMSLEQTQMQQNSLAWTTCKISWKHFDSFLKKYLMRGIWTRYGFLFLIFFFFPRSIYSLCKHKWWKKCEYHSSWHEHFEINTALVPDWSIFEKYKSVFSLNLL